MIISVIMGLVATQLGPTTKEDQMLKDDHPFQRIIDVLSNEFSTGANTPMKVISVVYGINPTDPMVSSDLETLIFALVFWKQFLVR
jgi:hypothetical protein